MEMTKKVNFRVSAAMNGMTVFMAECGKLWLEVIYIFKMSFLASGFYRFVGQGILLEVLLQ